MTMKFQNVQHSMEGGRLSFCIPHVSVRSYSQFTTGCGHPVAASGWEARGGDGVGINGGASLCSTTRGRKWASALVEQASCWDVGVGPLHDRGGAACNSGTSPSFNMLATRRPRVLALVKRAYRRGSCAVKLRGRCSGSEHAGRDGGASPQATHVFWRAASII